MKKSHIQKQHGLILVNVLVFAVIAITVTSALVNWGSTILKSSKQLADREQAFQAAEAGIDYYRWHLAHNHGDYKDGNATTTTGPYVHDFKDKDGNVIGQFALTITPPPSGSTVVVLKSKGTVSSTTVSRTIQATLAIPSLAKYSVVANDAIRFGAGTEVFGLVHSNGGIRFDGIAHNIVTSAVEHYQDHDFDDCGTGQSFGVQTCASPADPKWTSNTALPSRPDIFLAGRQFPVPSIDFEGMTTNLSDMKTDAQVSSRYFAASGAKGYHIILKTNDTFDLYKVNSLVVQPDKCKKDNQSQNDWGLWTIQNQTFLQNYSFPSNGTMFFEDDIWVDGKIDTARLTIAAGRFPDSPSTRKSITVNSDLLYTNYDGTDALALIAQGDINAGLGSADTMRIDAALVAQNGRVGRYYYSSDCGTGYTRALLTLYGMIVTNIRYGFSFTDGTGYAQRIIIYDPNLLYAPPPNFPLTSDQYTTISWDEVK